MKRKMKKNGRHPGICLDSINGFDVVDCKRCGFKHVSPIPTQKELDAIYRREYYSKEKPQYLARAREDLDWWNIVYRERYEIFEKELPSRRRKLLEVGSGPGFFLLCGKKRGWDVLGVEPSKQAAEHSRQLKLKIVEDFFNKETAEKLGAFDVICLQEVIEHVPNPKEMVSIAKSHLKSGGLLCLVAPNDYNPFQRALRQTCGYAPWWVAPPHHINYFDSKSLSRLLTNLGFEVIVKDTTFPIEMFLLMGDNYIGNDRVGRKCHRRRICFETNLERAGLSKLRRDLYRAFSANGIGRELFIVARKN